MIRDFVVFRVQAEDTEMLARPEQLTRRGIPGPTARSGDFLPEREIVHLAAEPILFPVVLP
jgi:hypothetical protein